MGWRMAASSLQGGVREGTLGLPPWIGEPLPIGLFLTPNIVLVIHVLSSPRVSDSKYPRFTFGGPR